MPGRVMVVGGSGMLGSMVVDVLSQLADLSVIATVRSADQHAALTSLYPEVEWRSLQAESCDAISPHEFFADVDWVINCIGITKPFIRDDHPEEIERAIRVNGLFPHWLARSGVRILQIATDCVYSGASGRYDEKSIHDAQDVYGKTKSVGETWFPNVHHLRCSIVGPEPASKRFLLEWLLNQPASGEVSGFTNHDWNGVTTFHFARLCAGIIGANPTLDHCQHILPKSPVTKLELLQVFAQEFGRDDITIRPVEAKVKIDRTLSTLRPDANEHLWKLAGYNEPPSVAQMVAELAGYMPRFVASRSNAGTAAS